MLTLQIPKYDAVGTTGRQNKITDFKGENDPAIWPWFKQHFNFEYKQGEDKNTETTKALLKLQMKKGDVEGYIKQFKTLRKSAGWLEDKQGMIL